MQTKVNGQADSLLIALGKSKEDTNKIWLLNDLGSHYLNKNPSTSIAYLSEAIQLSTTLNFNAGLIDSYKNLGTAFFYLGAYDSTKYYWKKSLYLIPQHNVVKKGDAYNNMGVIFQRTKSIDSSLTYHLMALQLRKTTSDSTLAAKSLSNIASLYRQMGQYDQSLNFHFSALRIYEANYLMKEKSDALNSIGLVYMALKDYETSLNYLERALDVRKDLQNPRLMASVINNIAGVNELMKNYKEAEKFYVDYLNLAEEMGDKRGIAGAFSNLGNIYKSQHDFQKSIHFYTKAEGLFRALKDKEGLAITNINLGTQLLDMQKYEVAIAHFDTAMKYGKSYGSIELQKSAANGLSKVYEKNQHFKLSLEYNKLYSALNDSLFDVKIAEKVAELQELYQSEKRAKEIQILQNQALYREKERELAVVYRNWAIVFFALAMLILIMLFNRYQLKKRIYTQREKILESEKEEYRLITELKETEIDAKNRELSSMATNAINKNKMLETLIEKLQELKLMAKDESSTIKELEKMISKGFNLDEDWNAFQKHFDSVHPQFFDKLNHRFPHLSSNDLRNCAYIRMNLSTKEVSILMNITPKSAKMNRYRLKKKLGLSEEEDLKNYLFSI